MPRQGRQPKQLTGASKRTAKPATAEASSSKSTKSTKGKGRATPSAASGSAEEGALDVYDYSARIKRPRGDVDPLARASFGSRKGKGKQQAKSTAAKGKGRAAPSDEEDNTEDEGGSDEDEDESGGFRVRGNEVVEFTGVKPAGFKLGMDSDAEDGAGFLGSDDEDEEIDSDMAEDEDEEEDLPRRKGGSSAGKGKARDMDVDLDEDEIDYDDEEGAGWMDLTEVLDAGGFHGSDDEDEGSDGSAASDDEERNEEDEEMSDDDDPSALDKLDSFVSGLDSKKRKSRDGEDEDGGKKKKRVVLQERTEAYPEGEFVAVGTSGGADGKVNLDDLLSSFSDSKNPRLASLRKSLKPLASSSASSSSKVTTTNSHLKAAGPLSAPLPGRLQDKIDREAAYEQTKEETDKWNETVRRMKGESGLGVEGARHERLVLPLVGGEGDVHRDPNANEWSAKFQPTNELEASIQSLLTTAQMSQSDLQKQEKAALATLDPADLAARQAELRRQRDLMYRAERKAKRVAKIKSKAYRRIHRKAKERAANGGPQMSLEDLAELDAIDGGNRVEEERARLELQRAKERATLKHSGKGGRWAKKIDGLEGLEEERNAAIRDMVSRREELRKKIAGVDSDDAVDEFATGSEDERDSDDEDGEDVNAIRRQAFDELAALDAKEAAAKANDPKLKGVLNMKFMRDAMARADRAVQQEADELKLRLAEMDEAGRMDEDDEEDQPLAMSEQVQGNLGRMVFGPSGESVKAAGGTSSTAAAEPDSVPTLSSSATTTKLSGPVSISGPSSRTTARSRPSLSNPLSSGETESNPWLALATGDLSSKLSRKSNKASSGKADSSVAKSAAKADRARAKQADAREAEREDAKVEIEVGADAAFAAGNGKGKKGKRGAEETPQIGGAMVVSGGGDNDEAGSSDEELDEEEIDAQRGKGRAAFKQRELVKEAFANDDVVADFAEEKRKEIERDAPREEDNTLPGWGSWGGKGAKKAKNTRKFITKVAGVDESARKDAGLNHVIISERKDRKAAKYMLKDLPFPYTSAAQHEHKLRTPLGPEWSTSTNGSSRGEQSSALPPSPRFKANYSEQYPTVHSSSTAAATEAGLAYSAHHPPDAPSPPPARQLTTLEFPDGNALRPLPSGLSSFSGRGRSASIPHVYGFDESRQSRFSGFATSSERHDDSAGSALAERDTGSAGGRPSGDFGLRWSPTDPRHDPSRPRALSISTADEYRTRSWLPGAPHATSREREGRYGTADSAASLPSRAPPYYPPQAGPSSTYPAEPSLPPRYPYDAYRRSSLVNAPFTNPYPPYSSPPAPPPHMPLSIPSGLPGAGTVSPPSAGPSTSTFPPSVYSPVGPPPQSSWTPPAPAPPPPPAPAPLNDDPASTSDAQNTTEPTGDVGRYGCPHCPKRFARPSSLRIHMHSHTGEKPFTCPLCDRAFSVQSNLRRHLKIHKGGEAKVGPSRRAGHSSSTAAATPATSSSRSAVPSVLAEAEEDEAMGTQPPSRPASAEGYSGGTDGDADADEGDAEGSVVSASTTSAPGESSVPAPTHPQQDEGPPRPLVRTEWPRPREQAD
ncbi:Utp14 protein-domain-containing protein [Rhodotorula toruloides]